MKNVAKILKYVLPYWGYALLNVLFNILSVLFSLVSLGMVVPILSILFGTMKMPDKMPEATFSFDSFKFYVGSIIKEEGQLQALIYICILIVILFFFKNLFRYLGMYFIAPIRNNVVRDIRNDIYHKILILPLSYYTEQRKGDIMARMSNDVQEVEWSIMTSLEMLFREPIAIISSLVTLIYISPQLTLFVIILLPLTGLIIARIGKRLKKKSGFVQAKFGNLISTVEETISGLRIIKAFNAIDATNKRFRDFNQSYNRLMISIYRRKDLASPLSEFLGVTVLVVVVWFGGNLVIGQDATINAETFIAYVAIFSQMINPIKAVASTTYNIQKGAASVERIKEILNAEEVIEESKNAIEVNQFTNEIEYRDVSFMYEKEPVLSNVNLKIKKGKTIAIVGPSGGGKSTLVDLLPRFYDCVGGEILIDEVPIKNYKINDLRGLMGIVTQESILFNDTVLNNIAFGMHNVSEESVIAAAKIANAHDFIMEMENGYYTYIGDRGSKLSGGQRQRLSIARAILKNPPILILDEATSALDTESERLVQDALIKLMQNRTSVVIAHRLSTIQYADEIIVIQKGEIVERGNHTGLLAKNGVYRKLHDMQSFG